jgi:hypothetical protein
VEKYGWDTSYQMAPRAKIFRRDQASVVDLDSFKAILRYNGDSINQKAKLISFSVVVAIDYLNDPYSEGDPGNAICSRFDLESSDPQPVGCYDTKVTNFALFQQMISHALNGPTQSVQTPLFSSNFLLSFFLFAHFPNSTTCLRSIGTLSTPRYTLDNHNCSISLSK